MCDIGRTCLVDLTPVRLNRDFKRSLDATRNSSERLPCQGHRRHRRAVGLTLFFTAVRSPESNGLSEAFVKTLKRDYASVSILPDAATILALLPD